MLEELLHCATHETGNSLGFLIQDIETLQARLRVRRKYSFFSAHQFNRVVQEGWSLQLLQELRNEHPEKDMEGLSSSVKQLRNEWSSLPRIMHSGLGA